MTYDLYFKGCVSHGKTLKLKGCIVGKNTQIEILHNCKSLEKLIHHHYFYISNNVSIRPNASN